MNSLVYAEQDVKKILIVEDDLSLRPFWERFFKLRLRNVQIEWSVSCEEALKMTHNNNILERPYFLIITDIFLAGSKTGIELLISQAVRESHADTLLVSAAARDEIIDKFGDLIPKTRVVSKPLDFKMLDQALANILNGHKNHLSGAA